MPARYREVADRLSEEIRAGRLANGQRLPGEVKLAEQFSVSRSTVRQALACLQDAGLVETWTGAGSFITYDGEVLNERVGWSRALAQHGVRTSTRLVRLDRVADPELAGALSLPAPDFLAVDRIRHIESGSAISYERSRLPWSPSFEAVLRDGLVDGSLSRTMHRHGIHPVGGRETLSLARLDADQARLLERDEGAPFLHTARTVFVAGGGVAERVTSLLDPDHFRLETTFGELR
ncbi:GntR family transcriptional regulator [Rugosimonospora africana]|uniref:GntR family transcriptional regulator n=1 Tax=Rugosimonospora africana TaxID=556532 RepID=A0A8J3VUK6_9ACTN|nr:GntR family transcriptional regulator [Rugosimonospora africana]GIH18836.1 GntR family transcriptional regulator [Rugosimonospora africana]